MEALAAALVTRRPPAGVIFHSDRGWQYTSKEFADFCAVNDVRRSMGRRATCYDNAVAESFSPPTKKNCPRLLGLKSSRAVWVMVRSSASKSPLGRTGQPNDGHRARAWRDLIESDMNSRLVSTFTVTPDDTASRVQISHLESAPGIGGFVERLSAAWGMGGIYADELERLNAYARQRAALDCNSRAT
jgi:hypothetical protein